MNEFLAKVPFDLYQLTLFHLVVETNSFTQAGRRAGLTQSAITRQIRGMEERLGVPLFERTTRHVSLTLAGRLLHEKSGSILDATDKVIKHLQNEFNLVAPALHVGIARSIGLAYLPGFFFAYRKKFPDVQVHVTQQTSRQIIDALESKQLDAGLICPPPRLPRGLEITHRFQDEFTFIGPPNFRPGEDFSRATRQRIREMFETQRWLMINRDGNTGRQLNRWLEEQQWTFEPAMELDSFDMIVNLVSIGLGVSIVPHRVLPIYEQRRAIRRIPIRNRFARELVVVIRKSRQQPVHLSGFVENVLF